MSAKPRNSREGESGVQLVEWAVVTLILILAIYAVLQAIGPDIRVLVTSLVDKLR